jgi:hypothetical protein
MTFRPMKSECAKTVMYVMLEIGVINYFECVRFQAVSICHRTRPHTEKNLIYIPVCFCRIGHERSRMV